MLIWWSLGYSKGQFELETLVTLGKTLNMNCLKWTARKCVPLCFYVSGDIRSAGLMLESADPKKLILDNTIQQA